MQTLNELKTEPLKAFLPREFFERKGLGTPEDSSDPDPDPEAANLRTLAEAALRLDPPTVVEKTHLPPSEDRRDYFSHSVYWWKNPETPDGFPYQYRDGRINPVTEEYDRGPQLVMLNAVQALTLGWWFWGREDYAEHAAKLLRAWFLNEKTGMNPHMLYAQFIPGKKEEPNHLSPKIPNRWVPGVNGKGVWVSFGGVIEGAPFPALLDYVDLLRESSAWTTPDHEALQGWFTLFRDWLMTHQHGKDEASTGQNHAVWYHVQCARYAMFAGQNELAREILEREVPKLLEEQIKPDGSMPTEYNRGIGLQYVTFTLIGFINLALMGEKVGLDFWSFQTSQGGSLRKAVEWAVPFYRGEPWPYKPFAKPFPWSNAVPVLFYAAKKYPEEPELMEGVRQLASEHPQSLENLIYARSSSGSRL